MSYKIVVVVQEMLVRRHQRFKNVETLDWDLLKP